MVRPWAVPAESHSAATVCPKVSARPMFNPNRSLTWLAAMTIAAAEVNPDSTGWDMKLTSTPSRSTPSSSWMAPTSRASSAARAAYRAGSPSARGASAAPVIRAVMATGPTAREPEVPSRA
ncbi:hypothetical protein OIE53_13650 [Micromonospora sp. NBC_01739]|nr:hypothetical protein OIE53_13650 [Micromonospora sp. NBC_01739]